MPLMQLGMPTLFCHKLEANAEGFLVNYHLRMANQKKEAVQRFKEINFKVIAAGDSYNDTAMLKEAHAGILFRARTTSSPSSRSSRRREYSGLMAQIRAASARI
jgi:phosphoserine/homoserine phosphotransferase